MKTVSAQLISFTALMLLSVPALAAEPAKPAAPASTTPPPSTAPAGSSIQTPMDDLGLRKEAIPPALIEAVENPYSLQGLAQCPQIITEVEALDVALGKDIDLPQEGGSRLAASDLVNFAASSVIPFRGLIREVTGASSRQRQMQEAVLAGFARRAFLKGVGETRNCAYPARPANPQIIATQTANLMASLEVLCGPKPDGTQRTRKEEWLNTRKCLEYKRAKEQAAAAAPAAVTTPATAPAATTGNAARRN